jgi:hypothetical protein
MNIVKKIKNYNKNKSKDINKILNLKNNYTINFKNKLLTLYDDNNNKIIVSEYIFFGIYQPTTKLWIWASSIPGVSKKNINNIENIKKSSYIFDNDDSNESQFIYQLLTQDVILITDKNLLNLINLTLNYISNGLNILNPVNEYNNVQFIGITKIIEKYV